MKSAMTLSDFDTMAGQDPAMVLACRVLDYAGKRYPNLATLCQDLKKQEGFSSISLHGTSQPYLTPPGFSVEHAARKVLPLIAEALNIHIDWTTLRPPVADGLPPAALHVERFGQDGTPGICVVAMNNLTTPQVQRATQSYPDALLLRRYPALNAEALAHFAEQMVERGTPKISPQRADMEKAIALTGLEISQTGASHPVVVLANQDPRLAALYLAAYAQHLPTPTPVKIDAPANDPVALTQSVLGGKNPMTTRMFKTRLLQACPGVEDVLSTYADTTAEATVEVMHSELHRDGLRLNIKPSETAEELAQHTLDTLDAYAAKLALRHAPRLTA